MKDAEGVSHLIGPRGRSGARSGSSSNNNNNPLRLDERVRVREREREYIISHSIHEISFYLEGTIRRLITPPDGGAVKEEEPSRR